MTDSETTADLLRRLRLRYTSRTGHVLLEGVGNGAGFGNSGWSDGIAMSTWPSKGLRVLGFEVKASKADWQRELDRPEKNAEWQEACHEWYIVAPKDVVTLMALPDGWGLMLPRGKDGLRIERRSERPAPPEAVPLDLLAAVFRAAGSERDAAQHKARGRLRDEIRAEFEDRLKDADEARLDIAVKYDELARALGGTWESIDNLKHTAELVKAVDRGEVEKRARRMIGELEMVVECLRELAPEEKVDGTH